MESLLEHHALEQQERGPFLGTFAAGPNGIVAHEDLVDAGLVNGVVEFIQNLRLRLCCSELARARSANPR